MPTLMKTPQQPTARFEDDARQVLHRVRRAFAELLDVLGGQGQPRAIDLQKRLDIPSTLAWRVHRVARAESPFSEVDSIPGAQAVQRIVSAARKKGLKQDRLDEVVGAIEAFESLVREHADSRQTFNTMAASLGNGSEDTIDLATRKGAFVANSQMWGAQSRAMLWSEMYYPGSHNQTMNQAIITGYADLKRLHTNVRPATIYSVLERRIQSNDPEAKQRFGPILLEEFSTHPLPIVERTVLEDGREKVELLPPTMGNNGATTYFVAEGFFDTPWSTEKQGDEHAVTGLRCCAPAEAMVLDVLVYRDMFGAIEPQAAVLNGVDPLKNSEEIFVRHRLPLKVEAAHLGRGLDAMHSADLPRYPEMVDRVCGMLGWDASKFDVWRCRVEYPIMSSIAAIWFPLPEKGSW